LDGYAALDGMRDAYWRAYLTTQKGSGWKETMAWCLWTQKNKVGVCKVGSRSGAGRKWLWYVLCTPIFVFAYVCAHVSRCLRECECLCVRM